jgi:hypothetical protein
MGYRKGEFTGEQENYHSLTEMSCVDECEGVKYKTDQRKKGPLSASADES